MTSSRCGAVAQMDGLLHMRSNLSHESFQTRREHILEEALNGVGRDPKVFGEMLQHFYNLGAFDGSESSFEAWIEYGIFGNGSTKRAHDVVHNEEPTTNNLSNHPTVITVEDDMQVQAVPAVSEFTHDFSPDNGTTSPSAMQGGRAAGVNGTGKEVSCPLPLEAEEHLCSDTNREVDQEDKRDNDRAFELVFDPLFNLEEASEQAFTDALQPFSTHLHAHLQPATVSQYIWAIKTLFKQHRRSLNAMASDAYLRIVKSSDANKARHMKLAVLGQLRRFIGSKVDNIRPKRALTGKTSCKPQKPTRKTFRARAAPAWRRTTSTRAATTLRSDLAVVQAREDAVALFALKTNSNGGTKLFRDKLAVLTEKVQKVPHRRLRARIQRVLVCMFDKSYSSMKTPGSWRRFLPTVLFLLGMAHGEIGSLIDKHKLNRRSIRNAKQSLHHRENRHRIKIGKARD
mmetsp:Transcript_115220/g.223918  ORF Transcript_115220/g.223918 Transcript_115220/m.223918 type:complete len:457 (-) Transcript_115220:112-1482(-)